MKNTRLPILHQLFCPAQWIILFLILFLFPACKHSKTSNNNLLGAASIMETRPDSALDILRQIQNPEELSEESYATYALLLTEAEDKNHVPYTSDSLISVAANYFGATDSQLNKTKAFYYMGWVNQYLQNTSHAMEYYYKAAESCVDPDQYKLKARIYTNIGSLYSLQGVYYEAIQKHKEAYRSLEMAGDSAEMPFVLRDIARVYRLQNNLDSALLYYNKAILSASNIFNHTDEVALLTEMSELCITSGQVDKAYVYINKAIQKQPLGGDLLPSYLILGKCYLQSEQIDSARHFLTLSSQSNNMYTRAASFHYLSKLEEKEKHLHKSILYSNQYYQCKDSIEMISDAETIRRIQSLYNYEHTANENSLLKAEKSKKELEIYQLLFLLAVMFFASMLLLLLQRNKRQQLLRKKEKQLAFKDSQYRKSEERVAENNKQIQILREQLSTNEHDLNAIAKELIETRAELLEMENARIIKLSKEEDLNKMSFTQSEIFLKLKDISNEEKGKNMTQEDWITLEQELNNIYNNFSMQLKSCYDQISEAELHVCYLLKAGFSVTSIAKIVGRTKSAVSMCRKRLLKKINGCDGSIFNLDDFISTI